MPADGGGTNDAVSPPDLSPTSDVSSTPDTPPPDAGGDATDTPFTSDSDAGCECSIGDTGAVPIPTGMLSMPCYCAKQDWHDDFGQRPNCPSYDDAVTCPDGGRYFHIATYKNCNFVTVNYDVSNAVDMRVYDATTHELVGALRGTDFVVSSCGPRPVGIVQSGVVPGPECEIAQRLRPCDKGGPSDAAPDVDSADGINDAGACACTLDNSDPPRGHYSLPCYCSTFPGSCRTYREAIETCAAPPAFFVSFQEYAGCNLSVLTVNWPSGHQTWLYDFTTHDLVGATNVARDLATCGAGQAAGILAGITAIDPSCALTKEVRQCPGSGDAERDD